MNSASLTSQKLLTALSACLGALPPAQRETLLNHLGAGAGAGAGGGEGQELGLYSWTDLTYLLHKDNVSWAYYVQNGQLGNIQNLSHFYTAAADGTLPAVSWVTPSQPNSDHPRPTSTPGWR